MRAGAKTALVFALLLAGRWTSARAETLHRFAVVVGNDRGGGDTRPLLYAGADARKVYDILTRLGGVQVEDANLIVDGSAGDLQAALGKVERQAAEATRRGERPRCSSIIRATPRTVRCGSGIRACRSRRSRRWWRRRRSTFASPSSTPAARAP